MLWPEAHVWLSFQVGATIVSQDQIILGIGYNGFPRGCKDEELPWAKKSKSGDPMECKYPYVVHAEMNAILNKNTASITGAVSLLVPWADHTCPARPGTCSTTNYHKSRICALQKVYVTMFPCNECAKLLIQAGIREVIFREVSNRHRCPPPVTCSAGLHGR